VVIDLGCGAGADCLLASKAVGEQGTVVGIDSAPDALKRARRAADNNSSNAEFRLGEMEHLPLRSKFADVAMASCSICMCKDKEKACSEAFRVLTHGGRLVISDLIRAKELPRGWWGGERDDGSLQLYLSATLAEAELHQLLCNVGFEDVRITKRPQSSCWIRDWLPGSGAEEYICAVFVTARKPRRSMFQSEEIAGHTF